MSRAAKRRRNPNLAERTRNEETKTTTRTAQIKGQLATKTKTAGVVKTEDDVIHPGYLNRKQIR